MEYTIDFWTSVAGPAEPRAVPCAACRSEERRFARMSVCMRTAQAGSAHSAAAAAGGGGGVHTHSLKPTHTGARCRRDPRPAPGRKQPGGVGGRAGQTAAEGAGGQELASAAEAARCQTELAHERREHEQASAAWAAALAEGQ